MSRLHASLRRFAFPGLALLTFASPQAHAQWVVNGGAYSLASGSATIGGSDYGPATSYTQTGGTVTGGSLELGYVVGGGSNSGTSVTYNLSAGVFSMSNLTLGVTGFNYGSSYFFQTGGTASIGGILRLGAGSASNTGQYTLSGGTLTAGELLLAGKNSITNARFALNGGTLVTSNITTGGGSGYGSNGLLLFNGGTLQADPNTTSPATGWINSGTTVYVSTGGALLDTAGADQTINAALLHDPSLAANQLDAGLTKTGTGTLTLNAASTYTGNTTINGGLIEFGFDSALGASTNQVVLNGGGLRWASGTTTDISSRLAATGSGGGTFDTNGNNVTFATALSGTGALTKAGVGTLTLNAAGTYSGTYSGAFTVSAGTLSLGNSLALQNSSVTLSGSGALDVNVFSAVTLGNLNATSFALQNDYPAPLALTLGGGNTTATTATAFSGAGSLIKTGTGTITLTGTNTYTGGTTVNIGTLRFATSAALPSTGTLTVTSGATAAFNVGGTGEFTLSLIDSILGSSTFQTGSQLGLDTANASGGRFVLSDAVSGSLGLTKLGGGFLTLTGANTYTGGTIVSAGALTGNSTSLQGSIINNAAVNFDQDFNGTYAGNMSGTGSLTKSYSGNLTLTGTNTYTGGTTVSAGTLTGNSTSLQGGITDNAVLVFDQASAGTYAGVVSGTGSLTKSNTGTLTLTGANSYAGGTTISVGTLTGNSTSLQGNITDNAALVFDQASAGTYAGVASGTGSLTKSNTGTLTLTGANTYTGGTTISAGTLQIGAGGTTGSLVGNISNQAALIFNRSDATTYSGVISGTGTLTKLGSGTLALTGASTYSGVTAINAGTLQAGNASAFGSGVISFGGGALQYGSGITTDFSSRFSTGAGQLYSIDTNGQSVTFASVLSSSGGALTKSGSGTLTLNAFNTYTGGTVVNGGTLALATGGPIGALVGSLTINSGATLLASTTNAFGYATGNKVNSVTINGGTLNYTGTADLGWGVAYTISNGALLTSNGGVSNATTLSAFAFGGPSGGNTSVNVTGGANTIAGRVDLRSDNGNSNVNFTVASGATLNVTAAVTNSGTAVSFTKLGAGTMTLTGANTYTGGTALNAGVLQAGNASAFGSGTISFGGGTLQYGSGINTDFSSLFSTAASQLYSIDTNGQSVTFASVLSSSGGTLTKSGSGTLTLNAFNTYTGGTVVNGGTLTLAAGGGIGSIRGNLTINSGATVVTSAVDGLGFADNNSKINALTINGGTLNDTAAGNCGWGVAYTLSNGALLTSNGGVSSASALSAFAFGGPSGGNTSVNVTGGTNTIAGHVDLRGNNGNTNVNFTVAAGATLNVTAGISTTVGPAGLTKLGAGTMTLTGSNTYTSGTAINAGVLQAGNASAFGSGTISFGGGTLQYGSGITTDFSGLFSTAANQLYSIDTNSQNVTFASVLSSSGGTLTKFGAGTLTLSGADTYSGSTTITGGTLLVNGSLSPSSAVSLASGTTIGGSGTIGGSLSVTGPSGTYSAATASTINGSGLKLSGSVTITGNTTVSGSVTASNGVTAKSGTTVVSGSLNGSLVVNNTTLLTGTVTGSVSVSNGSTLLLTGTTGALTVDGTLASFYPGLSAPGAPSSPGTGTAAGSVTLTNAPTFGIYLGLASSTDSTQLVMQSPGSQLTLNGAPLSLQLGASYQHVDGQAFVIVNGTGSNGILGQFSQGSLITATSASSPGVTDQFTILYNVNATGTAPGKDIVVFAIPEPSAGGLLIFGTGLLGLFRSRKRQVDLLSYRRRV